MIERISRRLEKRGHWCQYFSMNLRYSIAASGAEAYRKSNVKAQKGVGTVLCVLCLSIYCPACLQVSRLVSRHRWGWPHTFCKQPQGFMGLHLRPQACYLCGLKVPASRLGTLCWFLVVNPSYAVRMKAFLVRNKNNLLIKWRHCW